MRRVLGSYRNVKIEEGEARNMRKKGKHKNTRDSEEENDGK